MGDSPAKKIDFDVSGKENIPVDAPVVEDVEVKKPLVETIKPLQEEEKKPTTAPTIKAEESDEPLLQENPHRFVLFPIKYHEVGVAPQTSYASRV